MNAKEWAERLNWREYREEMTSTEEKQAEEDGMVIVFGASDDLIEFRGVIRDELLAWEGGVYKMTAAKDVVPVTDHSADMHRALPDVRAVWSPQTIDLDVWASWEITTDIPHETFDILENGELYCRGVVFAWVDAFPKKEVEPQECCKGCRWVLKARPDGSPCYRCSRASPVNYSDYRDYYEPGTTDHVDERNKAITDFRMDELDAVMTSVDKWLTGDELKNNPATRAADAREIALKAVEKEAARAERAEAALREAADRAVSFVDNNYNAFGEWDNIAFANLRSAIMGGNDGPEPV